MTGQYAHNIDAKGRLFIPSKLREELGDVFYVTVGQDGCLSVHSDQSWQELRDKLRDTSYTETQTPRTMSALATRCEPDAQGRILLPQRLRQYAQLEKEVIIIGVFDRAEIWNAQRWTEIEEEALSSGSLEKAMQRMGL